MNVSPETIRRLDDLVRVDFQTFRDSYFTGLVWCGIAVLVGVLLEGPEAIKEALGTVTRVFPRGKLTSARHTIPNPLRRYSSSISKLSLIGWIFVVGGLAGEGIFEALVSKADGWLQSFNEILLIDASDRASVAEVTAKAFDSRIADAQRGTAEAQLDSATARKDGEQLKVDAETLRKENLVLQANVLKLQQRTADRTLTPSQMKDISDALRPFGPQDVDVFAYGTPTAETAALLTLIERAMIAAGWHPEFLRTVMDGTSLNGIEVNVVVGADASVVAPATALLTALRRADLFVTSSGAFDPTRIPSYFGPLKTPSAKIRLSVGSKP